MSHESITATVIVPVFNKKRYLRACVKTLESQTIDKGLMEAVFVDDGSTDGSLELLKSLASKRDWMRVISQENGGVCSARNAGIRSARGKYLFFLDPDDSFSPNVLLKVSKAFDAHYDEVDLFTYKIAGVRSTGESKPHYRYQYLVGTGVYDLNEGDNYLIAQTTMNVCVKNKFEGNTLFEFESENGVVFHEDQEYITSILLDKMTIGYCAGAKYTWHINESSATSSLIHAVDIFSNTMNMYEKLFSRFDGEVPRYVQALFVNDIAWKMRSDTLMPLYPDEEQRQVAHKRFVKLLDRIDDDVIMKHPNMQLYHRFYFMSMKNAPEIEAHLGSGGIVLERCGNVLYSDPRFEVYLLRTRCEGDAMHISGLLRHPSLKYIDEDRVSLKAEVRSSKKLVREDVPLRYSEMSRVASKTTTARFYGFRYDVDLSFDHQVKFVLAIDGREFGTVIRLRKSWVNFSAKLGNFVMAAGRKVSLAISSGAIKVESPDKKQLVEDRRSRKSIPPKHRIVRAMASRSRRSDDKQSGRVWLYLDAKGVVGNAWLQFLHDAEKDDGVKRYYVANGVSLDKVQAAAHRGEIIPFGGRLHKVLHLAAEKRLCSDVAKQCISPYSDESRMWLCDLDNAEQVYLQHGVLWAHMPWYYNYDKVPIDREVVSTEFEVENLTRNYGFREVDLIQSGMARYDFIESEVEPKKKILLCPSWRAYLVGNLTGNGREPLHDTFKNSSYCKNIQALLNHGQLRGLLEEHGYALDFKLHPNFKGYDGHFQLEPGPVAIVGDEVDESEYAAIITDYSSYSFDFVYLKRALVYYIPDEPEFKAGYNHYNELDIPLDDAFGEFAHTPDEVVSAIRRILENGGRPLPEYLAKEEGFFYYYDDCQRERTYRALMGASAESAKENIT